MITLVHVVWMLNLLFSISYSFSKVFRRDFSCFGEKG
jgi:hypothetical protein